MPESGQRQKHTKDKEERIEYVPLVVCLPRVHDRVWDSLAFSSEDLARDVHVFSLVLGCDTVSVLDCTSD